MVRVSYLSIHTAVKKSPLFLLLFAAERSSSSSPACERFISSFVGKEKEGERDGAGRRGYGGGGKPNQTLKN